MDDLPRAAAKVITECLALDPHEHCLIAFDPFGQPLAEAFLEAGGELGLRGLEARLIPITFQRQASGGRIPRTLRRSVADAEILISALTDAEECTGFRLQLLSLAVANKLRVLHMPGVDEALFIKASLSTDFAKLQKSTTSLLSALRKGTEIEIQTHDGDGDPHLLKINITDREPHACGGIAQPGEIMNFPTGEVYIAPVEGMAEGSLVINGATESLVMRGRNEAILTFEKGRLQLQKSTFGRGPGCRRLHEQISSSGKKDPKALLLGEFGVGLNAAVEALTGEEVWDEKALGTAHIALGANKPFGGSIETDFHRDLIFYPARVEVNQRPIAIKWGNPEE